MSVKTKTFKCKCLFHRRRRDVPLVRSPRDGNKPQYVIPADGVYLVVVRVWAKPSNKAPFTAAVHVGMHSPDSAVNGISIYNVKLGLSSQLLLDKSPTFSLGLLVTLHHFTHPPEILLKFY